MRQICDFTNATAFDFSEGWGSTPSSSPSLPWQLPWYGYPPRILDHTAPPHPHKLLDQFQA